MHTIVSEILRRVATRPASYKVPEGLGVVDELPRNTLGEVNRNRLLTVAPAAEKAGALQVAAAAQRAQQLKRPARRVARNG